ncbi:MAG: exported protein of unknown function, contains repeat [Vampirovibrio sp.]|nr:exported protein of unknown function, contains repeat [Vampirovibrio sp.]
MFNLGLWNHIGALLTCLLLFQPFTTAEAQDSCPFDDYHFINRLKEGDKKNGLKDYSQAALIFSEAVDYAKRCDAPAYRIANAEGLLGITYRLMDRNREAENLLVHAIAVYESTLPADWGVIANYYNVLGVLYYEQGHLNKAKSAHSTSVTLYETSLNQSKEKNDLYFLSLINLAKDYWEVAQFREGDEQFQKALDVLKRYPGKNKDAYGSKLLEVSFYYIEKGDFDEAERMILQAEKLLQISNSPMLSKAYSYHALVSLKKNKYVESETLYNQALASIERLYGKQGIRYLAGLVNKAYLFIEQAKFEQVRPLVQEASSLMGNNKYPILHGGVLYLQGSMAQADHDFLAAEKYFMDAIEAEKRVFGNTHRNIAKFHAALAKLYAEQGKQALALEHFKAAIEIQKKVAPLSHPDYDQLLKSYNAFLAKSPEYVSPQK